jgi:carbonic anhydrase
VLTSATIFLFASGLVVSAAEHTESVRPEDALVRLKAGNERFASNSISPPKATGARRIETSQGQHPMAIVVGCADSRTPPELLFDQNLGDLFVVRTAGNLVDDYAIGSIEYAVEHLGARLIVVLGHKRCGAVQAALTSDSAPGHIRALVRAIQPAVRAAKGKPGDALANAVSENTRLVAAKIRSEAELGEYATQTRVVTGIYDLDTGKVDWSAN